MEKRKQDKINSKKLIVSLLFFVAFITFAIFIYRTIELSTSKEIDGINLQSLAKKRTTRKEIIKAKRGTIYDSRGDVLAETVSSYKLIAYLDKKRTRDKNRPQHVVDKELTAEKLSEILKMPKDDILSRIKKEGLYQTEFGKYGKDLDEITKQKIEALELPGLDFIESYKRYYPKGEFASYVIGYAVTKDGVIKGEMGIEKQYDKILSGEDGYKTYQKDLRGYRIAGTPIIEKKAIPGKDIYLTIDSSTEFFVEQAIDNVSKEFSYDWFNITILDAKTGALVASSTAPDFDPNKRNITNYVNQLVSSPYEPGSTMKTFTYMASLETGKYNGADTYESGVFKTTDGTEIGDWQRSGWGKISYDTGYALSSNVGVINLIKKTLNSSLMRSYYKRLGFGRKTGIELPDESPGLLNFKYETEIFNAGFGQGITTTPIQNVQAMTALTNNGIVLKPFLVSKIINPETKEVETEKTKQQAEEKIASEATISKMMSLMNSCVNDPGMTGSGYKIPSGELIGKTGTAQIAGKGGYLNGKEDIISSFLGVYPKSNPKIIIYASIKRPSGGKQTPIARAVKEIVENLSKYYGTESKIESSKTVSYTIGNYLNKNIYKVLDEINSKGIKHQVIGNGQKVIYQSISPNIKTSSAATLYLVTEKIETIPDLTNLSVKDATAILKALKLKVEIEGEGYVKNTIPEKGNPLTPNSNIKIVAGKKY